MPEPPSTAATLPGGWPLAGHLAAFRRDRLALLTAGARAGDVTLLRLGPWRAHVLSRPDLVRAVLVEHQDAFVKSPALRAARLVLGDGLLTSEGDTHRRHRRLVQPALGRQRLTHLEASVTRHVARATRQWRDGAVVDVHAAARDLTLGVAAETILRGTLEADAAALTRSLDDLLDAYDSVLLPLASRAPWLPVRKVRRWSRARRRIAAVVGAQAARGAAGGSGGPGSSGSVSGARDRDVLAALLGARDAQGGLGAREVHDELVTLLLAGHETTASALTWTCHLLAAHPGARERVEAEVDTAGAAALEPGGETALPWTRAAVAEALRLYPPSWAMGRQARRDVTIGSHRIARGDLAIVSQWVVHRDPRWWPRAAAFDPARWLGGSAEGEPPAYAYFPFGGGRRRCVGEPMALAETVLAVAAITRSWRLEPAGDPPEPRALLTLRPAGPAPVRLRRRDGIAPS